MNKKMSCINSIYENETNSNEFQEISSETNSLKKINNLFKQENLKSTSGLKAKPTIRKGQIWLIDSSYYDYYGNLTSTKFPFLVVIVDAGEKVEDEGFCRIQPISPFIEYKAHDDYIIEDASIVGFPFLVETWNEQPVLSEILSYSVGYIEIDEKVNTSSGNIPVTDEQRDFRTIEVDNTAYLRNSVLTYLSFLEEKQTKDTGVVVNINANTFSPKFFVNDLIFEESHLLAAKTKTDNQNKYFELNQAIDENNVRIRIKRNDDDFIISVYTSEQIILKSRDGKSINGRKAEDRIIFTDIKPGLYFIENYKNNKITIRVK
jgi:hypothetical protein